MTTTPLDPARRARRRLAALAAAVALLLFAVTLVAVRWQRTHTADAGPAPSASTPRPPSNAVTWRDLAGVSLPFSPVHGPRVTDHGRAAGYSHTDQGAALAAVQVLMRTSASAGPGIYRPILDTQVIGSNREILARGLDAQYQQLRRQATVPVHDGGPLPGNDAAVAGYIATDGDSTDGLAVIDILVSSPSLAAGQLVDFVVTLQWSGDDWRVLAPPSGDWGAVAHLAGNPPPGMRDYRKLT
jgi:hypothetical protein